MKTKIIIICAVVILVIVAIVLAVIFTREGAVVKSGLISGGLSYVKDDAWSTTASGINGYCRVDKTLSADNLAAFHVSSTNNGGKVFLIVTQGDAEKTFEVTGEYNDTVDMSEFEPGRIRLRLEFENAKDVNVSVSWI